MHAQNNSGSTAKPLQASAVALSPPRDGIPYHSLPTVVSTSSHPGAATVVSNTTNTNNNNNNSNTSGAAVGLGGNNISSNRVTSRERHEMHYYVEEATNNEPCSTNTNNNNTTSAASVSSSTACSSGVAAAATVPELALRGPGRAAAELRGGPNSCGSNNANNNNNNNNGRAPLGSESSSSPPQPSPGQAPLHSHGILASASPASPPQQVGGPGRLYQGGSATSSSSNNTNTKTSAATGLPARGHFADPYAMTADVSTAAAATTSSSMKQHGGSGGDAAAARNMLPSSSTSSAATVTAANTGGVKTREVDEGSAADTSGVACTPSASAPTATTTMADRNVAGPSTTTSTTTTTTSGAHHPHVTSSAALSSEAAKAAGHAAHPYARPSYSLSVHLVALYKSINAAYCLKRRLETPGPKYNNGYDDKEGHYIVLPGEEILNRYTVQEVLGKGSFGTVLRCYDEKHRVPVALKITRHGSNFRSQAKLELDILIKLNSNPAMNDLVVKLLKVFDWKGHLVLVFELLSFNLYQLIKCTRYNGVSLELVRKFAYQLVDALDLLEAHSPPIIHCDLKPENVLLRNQQRSGIRLIDFGSACYVTRRVHRYIQSRFYRSPEVILYLDYTTAIDRWSLACVLVELHTGMPLFDGHTEADQLARFEAMLGPIPSDMVTNSSKAHKFFAAFPDGRRQLKAPAVQRRSLEKVLGVTTGGPRGNRGGTPGHDEAAYRDFHDFISSLLRYRPADRMSCSDALRHPFLAPLFAMDVNHRYAKKSASGSPAGTDAVQPHHHPIDPAAS